jgi:hypothetical protein
MPLLRTLGSEEDARLIYEKGGKIPKGWKKIGYGAYRIAYLAPSGVVYKVAKRYYPVTSSSKNDNDVEFDNYVRIVSKGVSYRGWRIPKLYAYTWIDAMSSLNITVVACEYIKGAHEEINWDRERERYNLIDAAFAKFDLFDAHTGNYVLAGDGKRYIVDLAC